jgi:hypothetical protein
MAMSSKNSNAQEIAFLLIFVAAVIIFGAFIGSLIQPQYDSHFNLTGIYFIPSGSFIVSDSEAEITDPIRDELNQSEFTLIIEIEDASINWTQDYQYQYRNGGDFFNTSFEDITPTILSDWEYGKVYSYSIKFLCDSDNETVRSLTLFDEDRFADGSFKIAKKYRRSVKFFDEDRPLYEKLGRRWIVYYGEVPETGSKGNDVFMIELYVHGKAAVS